MPQKAPPMRGADQGCGSMRLPARRGSTCAVSRTETSPAASDLSPKTHASASSKPRMKAAHGFLLVVGGLVAVVSAATATRTGPQAPPCGHVRGYAIPPVSRWQRSAFGDTGVALGRRTSRVGAEIVARPIMRITRSTRASSTSSSPRSSGQSLQGAPLGGRSTRSKAAMAAATTSGSTAVSPASPRRSPMNLSMKTPHRWREPAYSSDERPSNAAYIVVLSCSRLRQDRPGWSPCEASRSLDTGRARPANRSSRAPITTRTSSSWCRSACARAYG